MRLVISDYISQLKEKDELDVLLCDLLVQQGYYIDSRPKTGNRQHGVDIHVYDENKILLFIVKQGNITRGVWDGGTNSVYSSLHEIENVYYRTMTPKEKSKEITIIVATNGFMDEAVRLDWNGYVEKNAKWGESKISFEFWSIDSIVEKVQSDIFNEQLFGKELQSLLRKALYFVEETDYNRHYYERIIDEIISKVHDNVDNNKKFKRAITTLNLASQMISQYAHDAGVNKVAIMVSEYVIIRYWELILKKNLFEREKYIEWLLKFQKHYEKWCDHYYKNIKHICSNKKIFPRQNIIENRVVIYEMLGFLIAYAIFLTSRERKKAEEVISSIIEIINNYDEFYFPPYDININVIVALYRLLAKIGKHKEVSMLMREQCSILMLNHIKNGKYPAQEDSFEEAVQIEFHKNKDPYEMSVFWGVMIVYICITKDESLYNHIYNYLSENIKDVTKCIWLIRKDEEIGLYKYGAAHTIGEGFALETKKEFSEMKKTVEYVLKKYEGEEMSWDIYSAESIEFIVARYFNYIPRIFKNGIAMTEK